MQSRLKIDLQQIFAHEKSVAEFKQYYAELDQLNEIFDARDTEFADGTRKHQIIIRSANKMSGLN